ncbi:monooxygenase 1-like isoform X1 [Hordeum vulgare subsp. vulgare]|uniref:Predicted protein n=3 Tax=Hordeum vulgare subsp. vulgare TaxID=112509 RepID=F2EBV7_HORVV|nr:monooxygenase 1-like isoform X1 [Hordeum vulgare subsp. vulgare]XP_044970123.1 monooxygenase 1-like isoform X1 [Hordeum vulgare subsp. vulgare]BAK04829.1 predicted protein [Hordeum vulgare subsp. vulgare]
MAVRKEMATGEEELHGVLIVGGGICGLATALALHIKGIDSLVLEKAESLRATGAGISIKVNGWRALEQLKVSEELRKLAVNLTGMDRKDIHDDRVKKVSYRSECRCLKRSDLVETLARHLPGGCIRFGCQVEAISLDAVTRCPIVSTSDGSTIRAKVVIGCDGANSVVAKFLGLKPTRSLPMWAARAMTTIPEGHSFRNRFLNLVSEGISFRLVPMDDKTVYFAAIQRRPPKERTNIRDPALIRHAALQAMQGYPEDVLDVVRSCDLSTMSLAQICYRPPWHLVFQPFQEGTVTVAGDAMHAMGPFIGQGGSSSLEDAIVIARRLAQTKSDDGAKGIEKALVSYVKERRVRILRLSVQAFLNGQLIVATSKLMKVLIRAALAVLFAGNSDRHSDFDCGSL